MRKIFMLSFANIRKTKGNTISLFIMFLISALLVNTGLLVFINFGNYFDKMTNELNTSNTYYIISSNEYNDELDNYLINNDNIENFQKENAIWIYANALYRNEVRPDFYLINDCENIRNISKWKFIGEHLKPDSMSVYLPNRYYKDGGYQLNDHFEMTIKDIKFTFTIKGFIEDIYFSSTETGIVGIYLPHETFESVSNILDDKYNATVIFANLKQVNKDIETDIKNITNADNLLTSFSSIDQGNSMFSIDLSVAKMARVMMASMVALMIVAFAVIIIGVCLIVIRFRIGNSIEDDMKIIGSLKAIGYTSKQIISSIIIQFVLIAIAGSIFGITLSYLTIPILSDVFAQQSGIKWEQGFDGIISSSTLFSILFIVIIVSYFTARRINKLHPIVALRGGIITHSFRKNYFPLNNTVGSLPIVLAFKSIFQSVKQSIMMVIILIAVSFSGTFAVILFYNTAIDTKAFMETPGVELSNVVVIFNLNNDNSLLIDEIKNMNEVRKVQFIDLVTVKIDDNDILSFVMDSYSKKETNTIYKGRYPLHSNEVALSGYIANMYDKQNGDTITLKIGDNDIELLITGLTQGAYMSGMNISLLTDTVKFLNPEFIQQNLHIYLNKDVNTESIVKKIENQYGNSLVTVTNVDKNIESGASPYISIVEKVGISISIITIAIVILVLYFVINASIIRKKHELGIQKAIGFTTLQLMNQLSLSFLLPTILGVCIGSILGITQTNKMMSIVQRAMGIMKANYIITPLWIVLFGIGIVIISYLTSILLTYRVRNISAYTLVNE